MIFARKRLKRAIGFYKDNAIYESCNLGYNVKLVLDIYPVWSLIPYIDALSPQIITVWTDPPDGVSFAHEFLSVSPFPGPQRGLKRVPGVLYRLQTR